MNNRNTISNVLLAVGLLIMVVMALMPLLELNQQWMRWVFAAGAVMVLVARLLTYYRGPSVRIKRLHRILVTSGLLYCASAASMFFSRNTTDWIAFLMAGVVVQIYASWRLDHEEKKTDKEQ